MAGVFVIITSLIGFAGSVTLGVLGAGLLLSVLIGYGIAALVCCTLVLRQAHRSDQMDFEDYTAYCGPEHRRGEPHAVPARH
ncbi:hypothetical protein [Falsigemmobacter faecalis]|uniref:Uncharacterized protein n=1 Tax=Falsigemmobacter faecalis TaxID=2488730 RepID=A0A3P3DH15_9RHOB|nr:hypothetical protein [Falsigemmobacter faecalis]RRH73533.1 hypothetical protein EG244_12700 [Falsigemmobacter faecalis]